MSLSDSISFGPVAVPVILIIFLTVAAGAYFTGSFILNREKNLKRLFSDLLFSPILPFLLSWKLSLLITDSRDVITNPRLILYSSGSLMNIVIGILVAAIWFLYSWRKKRPPEVVNKALAGAMITILALSLTVAGYLHFTNRDDIQRTQLPIVDFKSTDGKSWNISDAEGQTVILNFWASWCPPCKAEMPMLERLQQDPGLNDVVFFAVNAAVSEKKPDDGVNWMDSNGIVLPLLLDITGRGMQLYGISALPTTIIIDRDGQLVDKKTGAVSRSWILSAVRKSAKPSRKN